MGPWSPSDMFYINAYATTYIEEEYVHGMSNTSDRKYWKKHAEAFIL